MVVIRLFPLISIDPTSRVRGETYKGILNRSGRTQRRGVERNQKRMKPTNSWPVVGIEAGRKLGMAA